MTSSVINELTRKRDDLLASLDDTANRIAALPADAPEEERKVLDEIFERDNSSVQRLTGDIRRREQILEQRGEFAPQESDDPKPSNGKAVRVGKEPLVYERGGPRSFFLDMMEARSGSIDAQERLRTHAAQMRVELRDITTTAGAGGEFVPPLWLQNQWIELLRAARPIADSVTGFPLPAGTNSINLPKLSGGGATAIQASENAGVQETDPTTTSVSAPVCTIAGQVDMSRQLYEFSNPGLDEVIFRDLTRDYATKLDVQVISGSGSAGQARGIRNVAGIGTVTYTQATPTAATLWPKVADAIQRVNAAYLTPDTIAMHPRRWASLLSALDSSGRPFINAVAPFNALGTMNPGGADVSQGPVGMLQGLRVILDPNIPTTLGAGTNEDIVIVYDSNQLFLFEEGAPRTRVFEDIGSGTMTVRLSLYGFFAFLGTRYPAGISIVTGTGLITPTF